MEEINIFGQMLFGLTFGVLYTWFKTRRFSIGEMFLSGFFASIFVCTLGFAFQDVEKSYGEVILVSISLSIFLGVVSVLVGALENMRSMKTDLKKKL